MILPRPLAALAGWAAAAAAFVLQLGVDDAWPVTARAPLAVAVFLLLPGLGIVGALRLRLEPASCAALALALSLALDLLAATALVAARTATLPHLLFVLGLVAMVSSFAAAAPRGAA